MGKFIIMLIVAVTVFLGCESMSLATDCACCGMDEKFTREGGWTLKCSHVVNKDCLARQWVRTNATK